MNYSKFSTLLAVIIALTGQVTTQTALCDYGFTWFNISDIQPIAKLYYTCHFVIQPTGINIKDTNLEKHLPKYSDAYVKYLRIKRYKIGRFTSIYCNKFSNLEAIDTDGAAIQLLNADSLVNCKKLKYLSIKNNEFGQLPDTFMVQNSKLLKIFLTNNRLETLPEKSFLTQKELVTLDLCENQIKFLPGNIFRQLVKLQELRLYNNKIQSINPEWFATIRNLRLLSLQGNQIAEIPSKCFAPVGNLLQLWLYENRIKTLHSDNFDGLQYLLTLSLSSNDFSDLPFGVFAPLRNLRELFLFGNKLTIIHSDSFGIHKQLTKLQLESNQVNAIDPRLIDNTAVSTLNLKGNICSHLDITARSDIKPSLKGCFDKYQPRRLPQTYVQKPDPALYSAPKRITCGQQIAGQGNIIGGAFVRQGDYPWVAALITTADGNFFCGGSVVTNRKIVTAAHCIQEKKTPIGPKLPRDITVSLGVYNLKNSFETGRQNFPVLRVKMHPDWNPQIFAYDADIAVLVLANDIIFSPLIQPICLPRSSNIEAITSGYVVGFGKSEDETKNHEDIPKVIETPIQKNDDCFRKYNALAGISSYRTFCGGTGTGIGVCKGDSGSGLIVKSGNAYFLRGVVSSSLIGGQYGCNVDAYSVFTDVTKHVKWIDSIPSRF